MKLFRKVATALAGVAMTFAAHAAEFPEKMITFVVPFAAGGPTDAIARTLAAGLGTELGQTVIVENKAGAGGNIGADSVSRADPDGYTILFGTSGPLAINQFLYTGLGYDPVKSFAPIIEIGYLPNVLVVNPNVPANNISELIAHAKANVGKLSFASSGIGASSHLAGVMFNAHAGTDILHVPYKGTAPALTDLLGGQVEMTFTDVLTALPYIKSGKLRALGVTTATRSGSLPDVPTFAEQGLKDFDVSVFFGVVAPAGTPADVVAKLNESFAKVLQEPKIHDTLMAQGLESPPAFTPEQLGSYMVSEAAKWKDIIVKAGVKAQ
jgi:tripartite-type tricarboxylate transporter receptor subunit TctC